MGICPKITVCQQLTTLNSRALRYVKAELARVQEEYEANRRAKVRTCGVPFFVCSVWCFLCSVPGI